MRRCNVKLEKIAVRAYYRVLEQMTEGLEEHEAAITAVDAGEWSGPMLDEAHMDYEQAALELVARRFDKTPDELWDDTQMLEDMYEHRLRNATVPWEPWTDKDGNQRHGRVCARYHENGLNCMCIPEHEQHRIKTALERGDTIENVIGPDWGPN
jgi:hypothetical protein